jgi:hypothetical protein
MSELSLYALALMLNYLSETVLLGFAIALPNLRAIIANDGLRTSAHPIALYQSYNPEILLD